MKLLSESLEEQGKLRALLEYTSDPSLREQFMSSLDTELNNDAEIGNSSNNNEKLFLAMKLRGAALQQEKLLAEVITALTTYAHLILTFSSPFLLSDGGIKGAV